MLRIAIYIVAPNGKDCPPSQRASLRELMSAEAPLLGAVPDRESFLGASRAGIFHPTKPPAVAAVLLPS